MGKFIRIVAYLIGLLIVVVAGAAIIVPMVVDPNDYKPEISSLVKETTGRELDIHGDIDLSVFPWLALKLGAISLSNAQGFGDAPFAAVKSASIRVKLMPLLQSQVEMDTVSLDGLVLNLRRNTDGRTNWDDLVGQPTDGSPAGTTPTPESEQPAPSQPPAIAALAIGGVSVNDARLVWDDRMANQHVVLDELNLETGAIEPGEPVDLNVDFDLVGREPSVSVHTQLSGSVALNEALSTVGLRGLDLTVDVREAPQNIRGTLRLLGDVQADVSAQRAQVTGLKLDVDLEEGPENIKGNLTLLAEIVADVAAQNYRIGGMRLQADVREGPEKMRGKLDLKADVSADLGSGEVRIAGVDLRGDLEQGPQDISGKLQLLSDIVGNTVTQQYRVDGLAVDVSVQGETLPGGGTKVVLSAKPEVDLSKQTLLIDDLKLSAYEVVINGKLEGKAIVDAPMIRGSVSIPAFSPRALLQALDQPVPETADTGVLSSAEASFNVTAGPDSADLGELTVRLDDSVLTGTLGVKEFDTPAVRFALALNGINVDRYLPPRPEGSEDAPAAAPLPAEAAAAKTVELPLEQLRALDVDGTLQIGDLEVNGMKAGDVRVTIKAKDGQLKAEQKIGRFYQGSLISELGLDARSDNPAWSLVQELQGVQMEPLLEDTQGEAGLAGTAEFSVDLKGRGLDPDRAKETASGNVAFAFRDGAILGFNLARVIREAVATLSGKPLPPSVEPDKTDFSEILGSATVDGGIVRNDDLRAKSPFLRVEGQGQVDLVGEQVDYLIKPVLVGTLEGQGGTEIDKLKGIPIPVRFVGDLYAPSWKLDLAAAASAAQKAKLEEAKKDVKQKLEKKLQEALRDNFNLVAPRKDSEAAPGAGETQSAAASGEGSGSQEQAGGAESEEKMDLEKELKDTLKGLFR